MLNRINPRMQQILKTNTTEHLCAHTIGDTVDDLRTIFGGIDMCAERALAERHIDNVHDGIGD